MSFKPNKTQQMAIHDSLLSLTEREKKYLQDSWAEPFSKKIFPYITEDRFSVLYSANPASRPNNPVNVYFGLLILREIFNQSDEEALDSLLFDIRYQYALHTTSFAEQPVSKNSLTNEDTTTLVDGAYYSEEIAKKAKGIKMVPTNLVGGGKNGNAAQFEIDEEEHLVIKCPSGHKPIHSTFKKGSYRAHFDKKHCSHCPLHKDCSLIKQKKSYLFKISEKTLQRCQLINRMGTSKYQELARKRAGIEGIPSALRRRYKIDHLPVRGVVRVKVYLGFKISAINCKRLIKGLANRSIPELSTLLYNHVLSLFSFQRTYQVKFAA
jgi:hypothetical protein